METISKMISEYNTWATDLGMSPFSNFFLGIQVYAYIMISVILLSYFYKKLKRRIK